MIKEIAKFLGMAAIVVAMALPLGGGCSGDNDAAVKIYTPDDVGIQQCKADHPDAAAQCDQALNGSREEHDQTAPHLSLDDCLAQYGHDACLPRDDGAYYSPAMAGFMFGAATGAVVGSAFSYHPVYVGVNGYAYYGSTYLGTYRPGVHVYITPAPNSVWVRQYHYSTVSIPRSTPIAPPTFGKSPSGAPMIQRGGTGAGASVVAAPRVPAKEPAAGAPPPGAIQRGNTGGAAAISGSAAPKLPDHAGPAPGAIQRGNSGGAAAVTHTAAPPAPAAPTAAAPERHYGQPDRSSMGSGITRGSSGGSGSGSTRSSTTSSGKR